MMGDYQPVAKVSEIKPGQKTIVAVNGKEFGIFNIDGTFHAFLNRCPHMGAPLCKGWLTKVVKSAYPGTFHFQDKPVLRCPWHGWEFDIASGKSIFDESILAKKYKLKVKNGTIYCKT